VIIIADAVSMYTNIDTPHGIETLKAWLTLHKADLPKSFPHGIGASSHRTHHDLQCLSV
jgi:hypothetical protein